MIVCDAQVAFLAVSGALQPTPETLVTTPGQYFSLIERLRLCLEDKPPKEDDKLHQYIDFVRRTHKQIEIHATVERLMAEPDRSVIQIADTSQVVRLAADFAFNHDLESDAAFMFALAQHLGASLLFTRHYGDPDRYVTVGREVSIAVEVLSSDFVADGEWRHRKQQRSDQRRPTPVEPQFLASVS